MSWTGLLNHDSVIERFRRAIANNRLASTYLFVGQPGIGKRTFSMRLAQALLCEHQFGPLDACGHCSACQQVKSAAHPDLILVSKPTDKAFIPLESFIGEAEHRRQEGLIHDIGLKPFRGGRKIAIIDDADFLNHEGANSLLKTLEEPPPRSLLILIGTSEQRQLRTILSRSQVVRFAPLSEVHVLQILEQLKVETSVPIAALARAAEGSVSRALKLADPELFDFRQHLYEQLASGDPGKEDFAKAMSSFVDAAGSEGAVKRNRLSFLADLAVSFYRDCFLRIAGVPEQPATDDVIDRCSEILANRLSSLSRPIALDVCTESIDRSLDLQYQVSANVGTMNAVDAWLIQLGRIFRGGRP
jgi:DNA polymerase III subunit delta'